MIAYPAADTAGRTTTSAPTRVRCRCGDMVDNDELAQLRHIAYVCRRATEAQRKLALRQPGVQVTPERRERAAARPEAADGFGAELRAARLAAGISLSKLGLIVGCAHNTLSEIESGRKPGDRLRLKLEAWMRGELKAPPEPQAQRTCVGCGARARVLYCTRACYAKHGKTAIAVSERPEVYKAMRRRAS